MRILFSLSVLSFFLIGFIFAQVDFSESKSEHQVEAVKAVEPERILTGKAEDKKPPPPSPSDKYCSNPFQTTCKAPWPTVDPTGVVRSDVTGEVLALRQLRNIIRKNPEWTSAQIDEELAQKLYTPKRKELISKAFRSVIEALTAYLGSLSEDVLNSEEKASLISRISKIELQLPPPAQTYSDAPDLLTKNTLYYERTSTGQMRLRVGGAYILNATSWYNLVFSFAHEIGHAIDPCETRHAQISPRIYEKLIGCFVEQKWVDPDKTHCEKGEQISEVFSDWLAIEVAARELEKTGGNYSLANRVKSAINFSRDLCEQPASPDILNTTNHQGPEIRIGSVVGAHPRLRRFLSCKSQRSTYCELDQLANSKNEKGSP